MKKSTVQVSAHAVRPLSSEHYRAKAFKISSEDAARFVYSDKHTALRECFCGHDPELVGPKIPVYMVQSESWRHRLDVLSNELDKKAFLVKPSVVFKFCEASRKVTFAKMNQVNLDESKLYIVKENSDVHELDNIDSYEFPAIVFKVSLDGTSICFSRISSNNARISFEGVHPGVGQLIEALMKEKKSEGSIQVKCPTSKINILHLLYERHDLAPHNFNYVNKSIENEVFKYLKDEWEALHHYNDDLHKMPQSKKVLRMHHMHMRKAVVMRLMSKHHDIFKWDEHMVFDRRQKVNAREMLDSKIVEIISQKFKPGHTVKLFSYGSGHLGQEAIISVMLLARGFNVQFHCLDTMYEHDGGAALKDSFDQLINRFKDQFSCHQLSCNLTLYGNLEHEKSFPPKPDLVIVCDNEAPYFRKPDEVLSFGGKSISEELQSLLAFGEGSVNCDDVQIAMALKKSAGNEVSGFLFSSWADIKSIENYEDLQSKMVLFRELYRSQNTREQSHGESKDGGAAAPQCRPGY